MHHVSTIVLGQGLAGTALIWRLMQQKKSFAIIDRGDRSSCSYIAAGLVTPITGVRAVLSEGWEKAWPIASQFYRDIECQTGRSFWSEQPSVRFFISEKEREQVEPRFLQHDSRLAVRYEKNHHHSSFDEDRYGIQYGGVIMPTSAKLDAATYLDVSKAAFIERGLYFCETIDIGNDILWDETVISIPKLKVSADRIVFCQGYEASQSDFFKNLPLVPAQGDILTLRIPDLNEDRVIHHGVWLSRTHSQSELYRVGSTYQWDKLDRQPSQDARENILARLSGFLRLPFEIVDHQAGIRPTSFDRRPLIGQHPIYPHAWIFNGLGAKGTLLAPWCSQWIASQFERPNPSASDSPNEFHWNRKEQRKIDKDVGIKEERALKFQAALKKNLPSP